MMPKLGFPVWQNAKTDAMIRSSFLGVVFVALCMAPVQDGDGICACILLRGAHHSQTHTQTIQKGISIDDDVMNIIWRKIAFRESTHTHTGHTGVGSRFCNNNNNNIMAPVHGNTLEIYGKYVHAVKHCSMSPVPFVSHSPVVREEDCGCQWHDKTFVYITSVAAQKMEQKHGREMSINCRPLVGNKWILLSRVVEA